MLVYTREFLLICDHLKQAKTTEKKGYLIVEKAIVEALMNQNAYDTAANKLKIWKALHWIDTDEDRVTRRVHIAGLIKQRKKMAEDIRMRKFSLILEGG